jgi:hypothetical protein
MQLPSPCAQRRTARRSSGDDGGRAKNVFTAKVLATSLSSGATRNCASKAGAAARAKSGLVGCSEPKELDRVSGVSRKRETQICSPSAHAGSATPVRNAGPALSVAA